MTPIGSAMIPTTAPARPPTVAPWPVHVLRVDELDPRVGSPYCFSNLESPILDVLYEFVGFKVPSAHEPGSEALAGATTAGMARPEP
jgi:hypothetical protein